MTGWLEKHMLPCAYKSIFGFDCPGCGFQRSFIALLKGDMGRSLLLYPATIPLLLTAVFLLLDLKFHFPNSKKIRMGLFAGIGVIIAVSYSIKLYRLFVEHIPLPA
jgi:hypothetical protein